MLGIATGISWGFVAAVIKEFSSHASGGPAAIFTSWSAYALMITGAGGMLLASHAFAAGPLAASQPGFTILDPVTATLLGVFLFSRPQPLTPTQAILSTALYRTILDWSDCCRDDIGCDRFVNGHAVRPGHSECSRNYYDLSLGHFSGAR